jgi:hypothetical protein
MHDPVRCNDVVQHQVGKLQYNPGRNAIGYANAKYITALEFFEKSQNTSPLLTCRVSVPNTSRLGRAGTITSGLLLQHGSSDK